MKSAPQRSLSSQGLSTALVCAAFLPVLFSTGCQTPEEAMRRAFKKEGLIRLGATWEDAEIREYARKISHGRRTAKPSERSLKDLDDLVNQGQGQAKLRRFVDDALLRKGWLLLELGRQHEAIAVFQRIIRDHPDSKMDCDLGLESSRPGFGIIEFEKTSYYVLRHRNRSADAAKLGIARCHMRLGEYKKACAILESYVPAKTGRRPSKDPVTADDRDEYVTRLLGTTARYLRSLPETREETQPDGSAYLYNACCYDGRVWELECRRADKVAILLLAKCRIAQGRTGEATLLCEQMMRIFPFCADEAARDVAALAAGNRGRIAKDIESPGLHYLGPTLAPSLSNRTVERLRKISDQAERLAAARAHLMRHYGSNPGN